MDLSVTMVIDRPAAEVFDYVMDISHDADWRSGIVEAAFTSDPPYDVGATGFDRIEANGREMVVTWTASEFEPGVLVRWAFDSGPLRGSGGYICEPSRDGTRFTLEAKVRPTGWYRLLGPLFGTVVRRQNLADVQKLKAILESRD